MDAADFPRIQRLPQARRAGEDSVDFGMGNPDRAAPPQAVAKLTKAASRPINHRYSVSKGIDQLRLAITAWYIRRFALIENEQRPRQDIRGIRRALGEAGGPWMSCAG